MALFSMIIPRLPGAEDQIGAADVGVRGDAFDEEGVPSIVGEAPGSRADREGVLRFTDDLGADHFRVTAVASRRSRCL